MSQKEFAVTDMLPPMLGLDEPAYHPHKVPMAGCEQCMEVMAGQRRLAENLAEPLSAVQRQMETLASDYGQYLLIFGDRAGSIVQAQDFGMKGIKADIVDDVSYINPRGSNLIMDFASGAYSTVYIKNTGAAAGFGTPFIDDYSAYLKAYWKLEETGAANRTDEIAGHDAVPAGTPGIRAGVKNNACNFDDVDDTLTAPYHTDLKPATGLAVSAWAYADAIGQYMFIVREEGIFNIQYNQGAAELIFEFWDSGNSNHRVQAAFSAGTWHHVVVIAESGYGRLYIDGSSVGTPIAYDNTLFDATSAFHIGGTAWLWDGGIDEVALWIDIVFPGQTERDAFVTALYNGGNGWFYDATDRAVLDVQDLVTSSQLKSTVVAGTAPLIVASNTVVANLNADLLDGNHAAAFAPAAHLHDTQTLEHDGVDSDGGAFAFSTTGPVTFNQSLIIPNAGNIGPVAQPGLLELASNSVIVHGTSYLPIIGRVISNTAATRAMFVGQKARVGPAAIQTGDYIVSFMGQGYDGNDYETGQMVEMKASENWGVGAHGSCVSIYTTENASAVSLERLTVYHDGNVGLANTAPVSKLELYEATFSGSYGSFADERASLLVSGVNAYCSIQISSTYNSAAFPNYGLVLVNGPDTTDFDVWGIMHDGPGRAAGGLHFAYLHGVGAAANIHTVAPMVSFLRTGVVTIGTLSLAGASITDSGGTIDFGNEVLKTTGVMQAGGFAKTGWPLSPGVTLSFDDANRRLTVTDGGAAYYYIGGVKYTLGGNKTVDITDTEGLWYIYFDGATLTASQVIWDFTAEDKALAAFVYWDATNNEQITLGYELHNFVMDGSTHGRYHFGGGSAWDTGLLVSDAGAEDVNVEAGLILDEDITITIIDGAGASLWEQVLSPAELPIYYRSGASAWRIYDTADKANATDAGYVDGANALHYNKLNGVWASAAAGVGKYVAYYVIASNDQTEPIALIMGQRIDTTLATAKANNIFSGLSLAGLPFEEMVVLARLLVKQTAGGLFYTLEDIADLRAFNAQGNVTSPLITSHAGLSQLAWSVSGHYFDAAVDFNSQNLTNVGAIACGAIDCSSTINVASYIAIEDQNELRFYEGANYVGFEAPALAANQIWILPDADGNNGDVMQTNGAGTLAWVAAAGGGDVTAAAVMGDHEIVRGDGGAKGVQDTPGVTLSDTGTLAWAGVSGANVGQFPDNLADAFSWKNANGDVFQKFISTTGALWNHFGQNVKIGAASPGETWQATWEVIEIGGNASVMGFAAAGAGGYVAMAQNAYLDATDNRWEYQDTDEASAYYQHDGSHVFLVATSGAAGSNIADFATPAMTINSIGNVGVGASPLTVIRFYVVAPDAQSATYYAIDAETFSDATNNYGVYGYARGGGGTNNYGVFGRAANAGTLNHHFRSIDGDFCAGGVWQDSSHPSKKREIRDLEIGEAVSMYDLLDSINVKAHYHIAEIPIIDYDEENQIPDEVSGELEPAPIYDDPEKAPLRYGLLANDETLPGFLLDKDRQGMSAGRVAIYDLVCHQAAKKRIEALEVELDRLRVLVEGN